MSALNDTGGRPLRIADVDAVWLHCPLPDRRQHTSDFGRITAFDGVLVTITTEEGLRGYGEAKAGVGSVGAGAALVTLVKEELRPQLVGQDARQGTRLFGRLFCGTRQELSERRGRPFPVLGRRGHLVCALSGIDLALWDLRARALGLSVLDLVGGPCRDRLPGYASGGWADAGGIGDELLGYTAEGFRAVKMRVGAMDGGVDASLRRVRAAREALGPDVDLMVDAHGTFSVPEAKRFCAGAAGLGLRWLEEPVASDDRAGAAEVRRGATMPVAAGESEQTVFDFWSLVTDEAVDVLQPDLAICGGLTEALRIAAIAYASRRELAPHCWGSAFSFVAALTLAFASPAAVSIEVPRGARPLLDELVTTDLRPRDGLFAPPVGPGWGIEPDPDFVRRHTRPI